ncbi:MAG: cytochrome C oxidase subunit IV family protein [Chloroflexi bacterium]|nr:cytochrome C oxidase subunit IV family protein [Chloroflexota bacterium]
MDRERSPIRGAVKPRERAHPTPLTYVKVGTTLAVVTVVEVGVFYLHAMRPVIIPVFIVLSAVKFVLVAMFYMHLKFDSRLFSGLFVGGLMLATAIILALLALFAVFTG